MRGNRIQFAVAGAEDAPEIWKFYLREYAPDEPWNRSTLLCLDSSSWAQRYYKSVYSVSCLRFLQCLMLQQNAILSPLLGHKG